MRWLLRSIVLLALVAVATGACRDPRKPDMLAAVAESFGQADCAPVPLQLVDVRSRTVRVGPIDRWVSFAISPSADRIAAVKLDWDLCHVNPPRQEQTFTLVTIDTETFETTELRTTIDPISHLHWSPDERYLALVGIRELTVFDLEAGEEMRSDVTGGNVGGSRFQLAWPRSGPYRLVFIDGLGVAGVPMDPAAAAVRWQPECPNGPRNPFHLLDYGNGRLTVQHYCGDAATGPPYRWESELDLNEGTLGTPQPSAAADEWLNQTTDWYGTIDEPFEGGQVGGNTLSYYGDTRRKLLFATVIWSPSGGDVRDARRPNNEPELTDLQTTIAIRDLDGAPLYIPVSLRYVAPELGAGLLLDVTLIE